MSNKFKKAWLEVGALGTVKSFFFSSKHLHASSKPCTQSKRSKQEKRDVPYSGFKTQSLVTTTLKCLKEHGLSWSLKQAL